MLLHLYPTLYNRCLTYPHRNRVSWEDMVDSYGQLCGHEKNNLRDSTILLTDCGDSLGYYLEHFFAHFPEELQIESIIAL
ncbi:hypothetical protein [Solirubrum puertoriconensis]|uniref:hypothetical protein n=1 Tax=Solirubrum puertoriconensis TaxID=1751427 RepID=UPI001365A36E|nr:hypothetical protein [Solirubrum puertoriconensis]